jgi:hypothetical protein
MKKVVEKLDCINHTLEKMLSVMQRPENKFIRALETLVLFASACGIISVIDVVRKWIIGG